MIDAMEVALTGVMALCAVATVAATRQTVRRALKREDAEAVREDRRKDLAPIKAMIEANGTILSTKIEEMAKSLHRRIDGLERREEERDAVMLTMVERVARQEARGHEVAARMVRLEDDVKVRARAL